MQNQLVCQICDARAEDFESTIRWQSSCEKCRLRICSSCQKDWSIEQINNMHIRPQEALTTFTAKIKCANSECDRILDLTNLERKIQKADYDEIQMAFTKRLLQASDDGYIACPGQGCQNIGWTDQSPQCSQDYECSECQFKWRTKDQSNSNSLSVSNFNLTEFMSSLNQLDSSTTWTNLTNSCLGQKCPSCQVIIFRDKGCKFMRCQLCKYEWCWNCQNEFYTEFHFNICNDCPFRLQFLYAVMAMVALFLWMKISVSFTIIGSFQAGVISGIYSIIMFFFRPFYRFVIWASYWLIQSLSGFVYSYYLNNLIQKTRKLKWAEQNHQRIKNQLNQAQGFMTRQLRRTVNQSTAEIGFIKRARAKSVKMIFVTMVVQHITRDVLNLSLRNIIGNALVGELILLYRNRNY